MVNAAKRGVKIVVLTNSEMTSDLPAINNAAFHTYRDLLKAGVRIFERKDDRTIHSKIAVIGHEVAIVGSANLDNRSARVNSEVIAVVYDADFATKQRAVIQRDLDWTIAREVTREDLAAVSTVKSARFAAMSLIRDLC
jgi:cardiolipin synthase